MIVDSSAIVSIFFKEPGYESLLEKLSETSFAGIGCPTLVETGIVLSARLGFNANAQLARFIQEFQISEITFGDDHWRVAVDAYCEYGKGKHPAKLNFGDCMSYSVAKLSENPLLFVGKDFSLTDIEAA